MPSKYKPVDPPQDIQMSKALNEWAKHWHKWGMEVHQRLFEKGDPDPVDPPPPPPFNPG